MKIQGTLFLLFMLLNTTQLRSQHPPTNTSIDVYNSIVGVTNQIIDLRFSYTVAQVHHPMDTTLLRILEAVHIAGNKAQKTFGDLAVQYPDHAGLLVEFHDWVSDLDMDFGYETKRALHQGQLHRTRREQFSHMKVLDSLAQLDNWSKTEDRLLAKFCKIYHIDRTPEDPDEKKARLLTNAALVYDRKLSLIIFEATLYMADFVDAINEKDVAGMIAAREELVLRLPEINRELVALGQFECEKEVYANSRALLQFLEVFSGNGMVKAIGLRKKLEVQHSNDDIEALNGLIGVINTKYNPLKQTFYGEKMAFLQRWVPKK